MLNYYCLTYNVEKAKQFFTHVDPMLGLYERSFGPYPFKKDGFSLVESPYGMEHQGAVSMGAISNPINSDHMDSADLLRTLWHESAHEWWGNSVTCSDMADFWIHEAFASYAEILGYETFYGREAALQYANKQVPENKEPVIGFYEVNDFHEGDMYTKGSRMLVTLRNLLGNDSLWFSILSGIQERYRFQSVGSEDIIGYINKAAGTDYTWFFDQYLRFPAIPELRLQLKKQGSSLSVHYKWLADVKDFRMPVKVTTSKKTFAIIYPTTDWQTIKLPDMRPGDFKVDTDDFFIGVKVE
jgi:aminopeptidase N